MKILLLGLLFSSMIGFVLWAIIYREKGIRKETNRLWGITDNEKIRRKRNGH
jgi:hypothetical protein